MPITALLFDLDGTLVDSAMDIAAALSTMAIARGGDPICPALVRPLVSRGAGELVTTALGALARENASDLAEFRKHLAQRPADPAQIYPGVVAMLDHLAQAGMPMAIVTNKPEALARQLLGALGLNRYFGVIVGGDTLAVAKPDPAPLHHARAQLGHAGPAVMIGDSEVDAKAAAAAGFRFMLYNSGYGAERCANLPVHARFDAFDALPALVEALVNARAVAQPAIIGKE